MQLMPQLIITFSCEYDRVVWQHLHKKVKQYFPDSALKLVGGFLFLRFFCPAILAPHNFGLVDEPPCPEAQRHLTLVTKTLQNLANGMRFGTKEPYMGTHTHTPAFIVVVVVMSSGVSADRLTAAPTTQLV
jgi:hypothetical protein